MKLWDKPVRTIRELNFHDPCSTVLIEWLLLKPCCVDMYGSSVFSSVFAITERSEMALYDVPMFMFGFGIGMIFASFNV